MIFNICLIMCAHPVSLKVGFDSLSIASTRTMRIAKSSGLSWESSWKVKLVYECAGLYVQFVLYAMVVRHYESLLKKTMTEATEFKDALLLMTWLELSPQSGMLFALVRERNAKTCSIDAYIVPSIGECSFLI